MVLWLVGLLGKDQAYKSLHSCCVFEVQEEAVGIAGIENHHHINMALASIIAHKDQLPHH